jgi:hypothetical protein
MCEWVAPWLLLYREETMGKGESGDTYLRISSSLLLDVVVVPLLSPLSLARLVFSPSVFPSAGRWSQRVFGAGETDPFRQAKSQNG